MAVHSSNVTSAFVDLATQDAIEAYMYGGAGATTYFQRQTRKSTWFSQVPVVLSRAAGSPGFGQDWSVQVSRAGDYLLHAWLRIRIPEVAAANPETSRLRWTRNLMHNLIRECSITFNDLPAAKFDNFHLDFWTAFTVNASKRSGYDSMIGNTDALTQGSPVLPATTLNLPLPFFFSRDTGVALPTAAIPYNEIRINFSFRGWEQLLIHEDTAAAAGVNPFRPATSADIRGNGINLEHANVWSNYAIVSNTERSKMGDLARDILIEQVQSVPRHTFNPVNNPTPSYDVRFSHAVKAIFFSVRNKTTDSEWSNYTTASPVRSAGGRLLWQHGGAMDPIETTSLIYENTNRLTCMGSDFFSLVAPFYQPDITIPTETGYHMYSYSLNMTDIDPQGSTNFGKLCNVALAPVASQEAGVGARGTGAISSGMDYPQIYEHIALGLSNTVIRISGGALGFPVL